MLLQSCIKLILYFTIFQSEEYKLLFLVEEHVGLRDSVYGSQITSSRTLYPNTTDHSIRSMNFHLVSGQNDLNEMKKGFSGVP